MSSNDHIAYTDTYLPGQTLNHNFTLAHPPFEIQTLPQLFNQDEFDKIPLTSSGDISENFTLAMNASDKIKALGVKGKLNMTYGPVTGDANVKFAMNNIDSGLSLSLIYSMKRTGQIRRVDLRHLNKLKLSEKISSLITNGELTFKDFRKTYGSYVIIGFESGGEILFDTTYKVKNSEDKSSVAGGLSIAYKEVGMKLSGSASGNYKKSDISKNLNVESHWKINPSKNTRDQEELINCLNQFLSISAETNTKQLKNLKSNVDKYVNAILNPSTSYHSDDDNKDEQKLDWTRAIIYPLSSVPCVADAFRQQITPNNKISGFLEFSNQLYIDVKSKCMSLDTMTQHWNDPPDIFLKYAVKFDKIKRILQTITTHNELNKYNDKYCESLLDDDMEIERQIDIPNKEFYKINLILLKSEYQRDVLKPYNSAIADANKHNVENETKTDAEDMSNIIYTIKSVSEGKYLIGTDKYLTVTTETPDIYNYAVPSHWIMIRTQSGFGLKSAIGEKWLDGRTDKAWLNHGNPKNDPHLNWIFKTANAGPSSIVIQNVANGKCLCVRKNPKQIEQKKQVQKKSNPSYMSEIWMSSKGAVNDRSTAWIISPVTFTITKKSRPNFSGDWKLFKSENFSTYLKSGGYNMLTRGYAETASAILTVKQKENIVQMNIEFSGLSFAEDDVHGNTNSKWIADNTTYTKTGDTGHKIANQTNWSYDGQRLLAISHDLTTGVRMKYQLYFSGNTLCFERTKPSGVYVIQKFRKMSKSDMDIYNTSRKRYTTKPKRNSKKYGR